MAKTQTDKLRPNTDAGQNTREAEAIARLVKVTQAEERWSKVVKALDGPLSTIGW